MTAGARVGGHMGHGSFRANLVNGQAPAVPVNAQALVVIVKDGRGGRVCMLLTAPGSLTTDTVSASHDTTRNPRSRVSDGPVLHVLLNHRTSGYADVCLGL